MKRKLPIKSLNVKRDFANLSSAIRLYVVEYYRLAANASADPPRPE